MIKWLPLDDLGRVQTLLGVQVGGRLVNQVHVRRLAQTQRQGHALQLSSRQVQHLHTYTEVVIAVRYHLKYCHLIGGEVINGETMTSLHPSLVLSIFCKYIHNIGVNTKVATM